MKKTYQTIQEDGGWWVVDDNDCMVAGPYKTPEEARANMMNVCWGESPNPAES